jgi:hypothetical protein
VPNRGITYKAQLAMHLLSSINYGNKLDAQKQKSFPVAKPGGADVEKPE